MKRQVNFVAPPRSPQAGFSLPELVVTLAVILIISVVAIPAIVHTLRVYQLNSTSSQLAGMLKFARFEAIRRNRQVSCRIAQNGANWQVWADSNDNSLVDGPERQIIVTGSDTLLPAGSAPSPAAIIAALGPGITGAGLTLTVRSGAAGDIRFDQRGALVNANTIYVLYLGNAVDTSFGYRAVLVLPSGVVQVWTASNAGDWTRLS